MFSDKIIVNVISAVISSPLGNIGIESVDDSVTRIFFTDKPVSPPTDPIIIESSRQLDEYFSGARTAFDLPLKPIGTDFQQQVWTELSNIPFGETISYHELSVRLGDPKSIRAAASANGKNPIAIIIPCHRVIGSDGSLTGYAGGLHRKQWLLRHEGSLLQDDLFT